MVNGKGFGPVSAPKGLSLRWWSKPQMWSLHGFPVCSSWRMLLPSLDSHLLWLYLLCPGKFSADQHLHFSQTVVAGTWSISTSDYAFLQLQIPRAAPAVIHVQILLSVFVIIIIFKSIQCLFGFVQIASGCQPKFSQGRISRWWLCSSALCSDPATAEFVEMHDHWLVCPDCLTMSWPPFVYIVT